MHGTPEITGRVFYSFRLWMGQYGDNHAPDWFCILGTITTNCVGIGYTISHLKLLPHLIGHFCLSHDNFVSSSVICDCNI